MCVRESGLRTREMEMAKNKPRPRIRELRTTPFSICRLPLRRIKLSGGNVCVQVLAKGAVHCPSIRHLFISWLWVC
ncbi:hypothetical protein L2E82_43167 [Cichorium intybus]|uniref:Uncharacterized protein n=1 Tax=Cichorium intybus TaxID=13427 RepID=A0ACB8ZP75_CICIN|nr:hypothetical protein L2E82_43167 [Cichorium intybus]